MTIKTYSIEEMKEVLRLHKLWRFGEKGGVRADLSGADLRSADLSGADLPDFQLCPQEDSFTAYKKVAGIIVLKLSILGKRTSSLVGRKCRTQKALVLSASNDAPKGAEFRSTHDPKFIYRVGEEVSVDNYNPDVRVECTTGIHFFMTKEEAEKY